MTAGKVDAPGLARRLKHLASEYRDIRGIGNGESDLDSLTTRFSETLRTALDGGLLPGPVQKGIEDDWGEINRLGFFCDWALARSVVGYLNGELIVEPVECDEESQSCWGGGTHLLLKPGHISNAWPAMFDQIYGGQVGDDADVREVTAELRKERRFELIGYHAAACELLAEWIEEKLDRLGRIKPNTETQEHAIAHQSPSATISARTDADDVSPKSLAADMPHQPTTDSERETAWSLVRAAKRDPRKLFFIHYSSAIPRDFPQEPTPINAVAVRDAYRGSTRLFDSADESEIAALTGLAGFFASVDADAKWGHFNMRSAAWGFEAIEKRCRYLGIEIRIPPTEQRLDVKYAIQQICGWEFAPHPRFEQLAKLNPSLTTSDMMTRAEAAEAYASGNAQWLSQNLCRRVELISDFLDLLYRGELRTAYGMTPRPKGDDAKLSEIAATQPVAFTDRLQQIAELLDRVTYELWDANDRALRCGDIGRAKRAVERTANDWPQLRVLASAPEILLAAEKHKILNLADAIRSIAETAKWVETEILPSRCVVLMDREEPRLKRLEATRHGIREAALVASRELRGLQPYRSAYFDSFDAAPDPAGADTSAGMRTTRPGEGIDVSRLRDELRSLRADFVAVEVSGLVAGGVILKSGGGLNFFAVGGNAKTQSADDVVVTSVADIRGCIRLNGLIERSGEIVRHAIPLLRKPVSYSKFVLCHESALYAWGAYLITGKRQLNGCQFFEDDSVTKFVIENPVESSVAAIDDLLTQLPVFASVAADDSAHAHRRDDKSFRQREPQNDAKPSRSPAPRTKHSTERNEGREKVIAALTQHHRYSNGSLLNEEPIGNNELARLARVSTSTTSTFFKAQFGGHRQYGRMCSDRPMLIAALRVLNQEIAPFHLYGGRPPGEGASDDE